MELERLHEGHPEIENPQWKARVAMKCSVFHVAGKDGKLEAPARNYDAMAPYMRSS
jgi:hypothetical protein